MKFLILLLFAVLSTAAQVLDVDTFADGDFTQFPTGNSMSYTGSSMLGGERRVGLSSIGSTASVAGGLLTVQTSSDGALLSISYGATDPADQAKHLHLNATAYPGVVIAVSSLDHLVQAQVAIFSLEGGVLQFSAAQFNLTGPGEYVKTFDMPGSDLDVGNVSGFLFQLHDTIFQPGTFTIDSFGLTTAVPEPTSTALISAGLCSVVALWRKIRSAT